MTTAKEVEKVLKIIEKAEKLGVEIYINSTSIMFTKNGRVMSDSFDTAEEAYGWISAITAREEQK